MTQPLRAACAVLVVALSGQAHCADGPQSLERIPLAIGSDFQYQPVRANFPEQRAPEVKIIGPFEPLAPATPEAAPPPRSRGLFAGNYATCLLDKLPGVVNDVAAAAGANYCKQRHPSGLEGTKQGSGRGFLGYDSGAECTMKKGSATSSGYAGRLISAACNRLYDQPDQRAAKP
jgi:hypothetical protein